jgi:hypothetical protein
MPQTPSPVNGDGPNKPASNITTTRQRNARLLFQEYAETQLLAGAAPNGLEQAFAKTIQVSPSMWSQIKSARPIGDKIARQIEAACAKPKGWMDEERDQGTSGVSQAEQQMLALMLKAWRATNSVGRKQLKQLLRDMADGRITPEMLKTMLRG